MKEGPEQGNEMKWWDEMNKRYHECQEKESSSDDKIVDVKNLKESSNMLLESIEMVAGWLD